MNHNQTASKKVLTLFGFFAITSSMVMTVYEYPTFATSKFSLVFFVILGGLCWFLPTALISAEMASVEGWEDGGVFSWVGKALGNRWGFAAIFFQWFQITVGFVTMDYFIVGSLSIIFDIPDINNVPWLKFISVLIIFWAITLVQFLGTKNTAKIAKWGFVIGIIVPSIVFFGFSIAYVLQGNPLHMTFSVHDLIPDFSKLSTLVVFTSFILAFTGVEASASHVNELKNASRNYPLAVLILVVLAIVLDTLGGLTVGSVIPEDQLTLNTGMISSFKILVTHFDPRLIWLFRIMALLIVFGVVAEISSWVIGPSRGMYVAAQKGLLPKSFTKTNKKGVPTTIIIVQGIVVTIWDAVLTFGGSSGNASFLAAISLTVVIYLVCYLLMFIAYFVLIYKKQNLQRTYNVPGGKIGKTLVAIIGFATSAFAFFISFVTPSSLSTSEGKTYQMVLISSFIVAAIIPFIIYAFRHHFEENKDYIPRHVDAQSANKFVRPAGRGEFLMENEDKQHEFQTKDEHQQKNKSN